MVKTPCNLINATSTLNRLEFPIHHIAGVAIRSGTAFCWTAFCGVSFSCTAGITCRGCAFCGLPVGTCSRRLFGSPAAEFSVALRMASASSPFRTSLHLGSAVFNFLFDLSRDFVTVLAQQFFCRINRIVGDILHFHQFLAFLIFIGMRFGFLLHALDFRFGEPAGSGDGDVLAAVGGFIQRGHVEDAVGIDIKRHFDLRDAARRGGDAIQNEFAEGFVVGCHRAFALQHMDLHLGL